MDILAELKHRGLVDDAKTLPSRTGFTPTIQRPDINPDVGALFIWEAAVEAQETLVDEYLNRRGIYMRAQLARRGSMQADS